MSKVVCDVCGTSYPETSTQCPICGNSKSDLAGFTGEYTDQGSDGYAYVKGGRFSHANVRKRNGGKTELPRTVAPAKPVKEKSAPKKAEETVPEAAQTVQYPQPAPQETAPVSSARRRRRKKKSGQATNIVLLIIVILLVLAILAVCAYITLHLLDMYAQPTDPNNSGTTTLSQTDPTGSSSQTLPKQIPCTDVRISVPSWTFSSVGQSLLLKVTKEPSDTTDPVIFVSSDPYIASVDDKGQIVAVADGEVTITVYCGEFSAVCEINCRVGQGPDYPTVPPVTTRPTEPTTKPTLPPIKLELNRSDFTLSGYGSTHNLYSGELDPASITWTSSNEEVATVTNGIVKAVGNGKAVITAEYEGQKVTCDVHCNEVIKGSFKLSTTDTTIKVGESFTLKAYLVDENGEYVLDEDGNKIRIDPSELKFYVTDAEEHVSVDENGKVTGLSNNINRYTKYKYVYVEYNGVTLKCIVRVKDAPTTE